MDCKRARELVKIHIQFLATFVGEKVATKEEILDAFRHVEKCQNRHCFNYGRIVQHASTQLALLDTSWDDLLLSQSQGWDGDY